MHFVSYYYDRDETKSTYYKTCAACLESQLHSYGYKTSFNYINFAEQGLNTTYLKLNMIKPKYILQKMKELNDSVVWIDADCDMVSPITEFETLPDDFDLAYCVREHDGINPHAAVLYFNKTKNAINFLQEWENINNIKVKDPTYNCSEHCTLIDLLRENPSSSIRKTNIPLNIVSFKDIIRANYYGDNNILKLQASKYKTPVKIWIGISPAAFEYDYQQKMAERNS